jgi:hypothetical protein
MRSSALALLLSACAAGGADTEPLTGGDTCTALTSGTWTFSGAAWGMGDTTMEGDVTLDAAACSFTLDHWTMAMDDLPSGGVLDGDAVQLDGLNSYWRSCTGTAADADTVSGTCSDDGADWTMTAGGAR